MCVVVSTVLGFHLKISDQLVVIREQVAVVVAAKIDSLVVMHGAEVKHLDETKYIKERSTYFCVSYLLDTHTLFYLLSINSYRKNNLSAHVQCKINNFNGHSFVGFVKKRKKKNEYNIFTYFLHNIVWCNRLGTFTFTQLNCHNNIWCFIDISRRRHNHIVCKISKNKKINHVDVVLC